MIGIRADGNHKIGMGHLMRTGAIAAQLQQMGCEVCYFVADEESKELARRCGITAPIVVLREQSTTNADADATALVSDAASGYGDSYSGFEADPMNEIPTLLPVLRQHSVDTLLIDTYAVTPEYLLALTAVCRTAYLDDLNAFLYPVDLVINYNWYAEDLDYETRYRDAGMKTRFLLGPTYAPLREIFRNAGAKAGTRQETNAMTGIDSALEECDADTVNNEKNGDVDGSLVLLSAGGTDPYRVLPTLLKTLIADPALQGIAFEVAAGGSASADRDEWEGNQVTFLTDPNAMPQRMAAGRYVAAVTAFGSTVYELCACGVPAAGYVLADNQLQASRKFSEEGLVPCIGDARESVQEIADGAAVWLKEMLGDNDTKYSELASRMRTLTDGRGAERIARELIKL